MTRRTSRYLTLGAAVAAFAATVTDPPRAEEQQRTQSTICADCPDSDDARTEQREPPARA